MSAASTEYPLCWIEAHSGNQGNSIKQETTRVRKILKSRCPTLSVRMGLGTARNFIDILGSLDEFGRFTPIEKRCLKSFGIPTGLGGGVVLDWQDREQFLKKYEGSSASNPNSLKQNVAKLRKIVKDHCPTVSVRMGSGTVYGWAQIQSRDRGALFTDSEKECLRGLGLNPGSNWLPIPPDKVREFLKKHATSNPKVSEDVETKVLDALEEKLALNLRKQVMAGLGEVFEQVGCGAVGREIRAGRNVTGNAAFGIVVCVHPKSGPRVDPGTLEFFPQTDRGRELDEAFIEKTNQMLETGGFPRMNPKLLSDIRKKDKEFEQEIAARRSKR